MPELWLASTSPYRLRMLEAAGIRVRAQAPGVDEASSETDPVRLARELALRKAEALSARRPGDWVIGADQVAHDLVDRAPFGKPADAGDHLRMLRAMVGRSHALVTGVALVGPGFADAVTEVTVMRVRADLDEAELRAYVATGEGTSCAGGYAAEGRGAFLFERIEGDFFNVVGLPLLRVFTLLRARGWRFE
jgi:septum formation protein